MVGTLHIHTDIRHTSHLICAHWGGLFGGIKLRVAQTGREEGARTEGNKGGRRGGRVFYMNNEGEGGEKTWEGKKETGGKGTKL